MEPLIQTIELTKIYKDFWGRGHVRALDGLNIEIERGDVFGLLGPNGSGKTTTVKLVLGLLFPTRGVIRVFGKSPRQVDVKKRIGYMPEESHLYDYLSARETLDFFGRLFGLSRSDRRERTESLIDMVGLGRARNRPIGEFSKGMARRIGLAQALINDPDLLILDEPTTGLDPIGAKEMKDLIQTLKERGKTVFLCSHLLSDVEQVCDRIAILYGGKMRTDGTVGELLKEKDKMQMRLPQLPPEAFEEIKNTVKKYTTAGGQADGGVEVMPAERRLEDFFLEVVRRAKKERVATAGAESGTGAADFLAAGAEKDAGEELIKDLTRKTKEKMEEEEKEVAEAEPPIEEKEDVELIERLSKIRKEEELKKEGEPEEPGAAEELEGEEEKRDLVEGLVKKKDQSEGGEEDDGQN